jgi:hypothetical protein
METYRYYPPRWQGRQERNFGQDGIVSVVYACARFDRRVFQSPHEVVPSLIWIGAHR